MADDHTAAAEEYRIAASRTTSVPEQRYLTLRAARTARRQSISRDGGSPSAGAKPCTTAWSGAPM
ncbi:hypothetical protein H4W32_006621 [Actinophytocola algeriensis]|uniref:Uncharacterized protein n=1 Tax=Actinophytocola algeriensis TaxID=1768010 RepID=A0A7W7VEB6_9PSEU|nr:hypothetical protein [Actinophytocola algeriensis]MBE1478579.1 hypothetical protein [Actinophytocola algeriensis]